MVSCKQILPAKSKDTGATQHRSNIRRRRKESLMYVNTEGIDLDECKGGYVCVVCVPFLSSVSS